MDATSNFSVFEEISGKRKYQGNWVVIIKKKVVASGSAREVKDAMANLRKENPDEVPFIGKVPGKMLQIV